MKVLQNHPERLDGPAIPFGELVAESGEIFYVSNIHLGSGTQGSVMKAYRMNPPSAVAVKSVRKIANYDRAVRELDVQRDMEHRNIVRFLAVERNRSNVEFRFVMEFCSGGSLAALLERKKISPPRALEILQRLLSGYKVLHDKNIVHRDIKPANILFADSSPHAEPKLADFGTARVLVAGLADTLVVGSKAYAAPEVLRAVQSYTSKCDVWSFGVVYFEMLTGSFMGLNEKLLSASSDEDISKVLEERIADPAAVGLLQNMLRVSAEDRYSVQQLLDAIQDPSHAKAADADDAEDLRRQLEDLRNVLRDCTSESLELDRSIEVVRSTQAQYSNLVPADGDRASVLAELRDMLRNLSDSSSSISSSPGSSSPIIRRL